jgi:hypothetical protein
MKKTTKEIVFTFEKGFLRGRPKKDLHVIGSHGAIGFLMRRGNKLVRVCGECYEEIKVF